MTSLVVKLLVACCGSLSILGVAHAQVQESDLFDFEKLRGSEFRAIPNLEQDLMFITKYTDPATSKDFAIITFGDTFAGVGNFIGNSMGASEDFDLSDGMTYQYRQFQNGFGVADALTPKLDMNPPPAPNACSAGVNDGLPCTAPSECPGATCVPEPDNEEDQIWFGRSFVLGNDIYTYYGSFNQNPGIVVEGVQQHKKLGVGLAVIRGGINDIENIPEFVRVPSFWQHAFWIDGHPVIRQEGANTYLYLFNPGFVQRVLFTKEAVEDETAYERYMHQCVGGTNHLFSCEVSSECPGGGTCSPVWAPSSVWWLDKEVELWDQANDSAQRATCEFNEYLQKWISIYTVKNSYDGINQQLAYRTAPDILGPWSERTTFYIGDSPQFTYSPVHRAFFDQDGGRTFYTFFSLTGSQGSIGLLQYNFDHAVTTRKIGPVPNFSPQGIDDTVHVRYRDLNSFYFRDTNKLNSSGNFVKAYPNASLYTTDTDASDGLS
jgi:hypothetical protein